MELTKELAKELYGEKTEIIISAEYETIGKNAFAHNENIVSVTIMDGVKEIGTGAFQLCTNLETITIPETVEKIGTSCFSGCSTLKSINIPNDDCVLAGSVFYGCRSMEKIELPQNIKKIDKKTFMRCESLKCLILPQSVKTIMDFAFSDKDYIDDSPKKLCPCELIVIQGHVKISEYAFGSTKKDSKFQAPPIYFSGMKLKDVPAMYKNAAVRGFLVADKSGMIIPDEIRNDYTKYVK